MKYEHKCSKFLRILLRLSAFFGAFKKPILIKSEEQKPLIKFRGFTKRKVINLDVYTKLGNKDNHIIFLHGGGYFLGVESIHVTFVNNLHKDSNATIHLVDYPLAPNHKVKEVIKEVLKTTKEIVNTNKIKSLHMVGDSAGGGMCLPISKYLIKDNININNIILLSPWLDLTMDNPKIDEYIKKDYILDKQDLIECGLIYSDNSPQSKDASPIYDDFTNYHNITIIAGTADILYPDSELFHNKFKKTTLYSYTGAPHDFMFFPYTKDQKQVIKIISTIIK